MKTSELIEELKSCKGEDLVLEEDTIDEIIQKLRELEDIKEQLRNTMHAMGECCSIYDFVTGVDG